MVLKYKHDGNVQTYNLVADLQPFGVDKFYFRDFNGAGTFGFFNRADFISLESSTQDINVSWFDKLGAWQTELQIEKLEGFGCGKLYALDALNVEYIIDLESFVFAVDATP